MRVGRRRHQARSAEQSPGSSSRPTPEFFQSSRGLPLPSEPKIQALGIEQGFPSRRALLAAGPWRDAHVRPAAVQHVLGSGCCRSQAASSARASFAAVRGVPQFMGRHRSRRFLHPSRLISVSFLLAQHSSWSSSWIPAGCALPSFSTGRSSFPGPAQPSPAAANGATEPLSCLEDGVAGEHLTRRGLELDPRRGVAPTRR